MPRVRFQPLRINKRGWRSTWFSTAGQHDPEKPLMNDNDEDDEYETDELSSKASSRASSGSYGSEEAMLPRKLTAPATSTAFASQKRSRRKCNRYFTIIVASTLVVMMLALTQMHYHSARDVELGVHKLPPKPALYEDFPTLHRYFGGIKSITSVSEHLAEYPRSKAEVADNVMSALHNASSPEERRNDAHTIRLEPLSRQQNETHPCSFGKGDSPVTVLGIEGIPQGFPAPISGINMSNPSHAPSVCLERFGRLGPYGLGYSRHSGGSGGGQEGDRTYVDQVWAHQKQVDFRGVDWAAAQSSCAASSSSPTQPRSVGHSKSAILYTIQVHHHFDAEEIMALRALITETSLAAGEKYAVHILVQIPEGSAGVWSDDKLYQSFLEGALPAEFRGLGTLWSVDQMHLGYGDVARATHEDGTSSLLAVQHFARQHLDYDFFWVWDPRVRSTGHIGDVLEELANWSTAQPMKELWNRNDRFYIPTEHGSWDDFRHMVRVQSEHGLSQKASIWSKAALRPDDADPSRATALSKPVWGPLEPISDALDEIPEDRRPPVEQSRDHYEWGIGHEADLISLSPIFDTDGTLYGPSEAISGYNVSAGYPPRRATLSGLMRLSRPLLESMHRESMKGRGMHASMWAASIALHYGYKAVYAPQATYIERMWPTDYLAAVLNSGLNGAVGGARSSVFDDSRTHNLQGLSFAATSQFATKLWKRWLGYRVEGQGGEEWELREEGEGRMCLPPMMLWPVEGIELIIQ